MEEALAKRDSGAFILDVRQPEEWNEFHAPNTTLIPLDQLATRLNEVPRDRQVVVVCRSGNRSQQGRDILRNAGFEQVTRRYEQMAETLGARPWLALAALQGLMLAGNFYLLAHTAQRVGVAVAALASRVSVAIPVVVGFAVFGDAVTVMKSAGLLGAFVSLYLSSEPSGSRSLPTSRRVLPVVLFFSFGSHFTLLKVAQAFYLGAEVYHLYVTSAFFFAFVASLPGLAWVSARGGTGLLSAHRLWGIVLGVLNYCAVYFLIRVLSLESWETSQVYPIYSVGVVLVSTSLAMVLFGEKLSHRKRHGLIIGIASVALLNR